MEDDEKFGFIIVDGAGALFATLQGNVRTILQKITQCLGSEEFFEWLESNEIEVEDMDALKTVVGSKVPAKTTKEWEKLKDSKNEQLAVLKVEEANLVERTLCCPCVAPKGFEFYDNDNFPPSWLSYKYRRA